MVEKHRISVEKWRATAWSRDVNHQRSQAAEAKVQEVPDGRSQEGKGAEL